MEPKNFIWRRPGFLLQVKSRITGLIINHQKFVLRKLKLTKVWWSILKLTKKTPNEHHDINKSKIDQDIYERKKKECSLSKTI